MKIHEPLSCPQAFRKIKTKIDVRSTTLNKSKEAETCNDGYSIMAAHPSTDPPACCLLTVTDKWGPFFLE